MTEASGWQSAKIDISPLELMALKKLALVSRSLETMLSDYRAKAEQKALTSVLVEVIARADLANATAPVSP